MISDVSLRSEEIDGSRDRSRASTCSARSSGPRSGGSRFRRGVREYAAIGDPARVIGREELNLIYAATSARTITIGHLSQDPSIPAYVDTGHMLAKHFAVVGSTGVGKSSAVASILFKWSTCSRSCGCSCSTSTTNTGPPSPARQRYWRLRPAPAIMALQLRGKLNVFYGGKPRRRRGEILAGLIPVTQARSQAGPERVTVEGRAVPRHSGFTADTPSPYNLQDLLGLIQERMGKLENRSSSMSHHRLMQRIDTIRNDPRYEFMFKQANLGGDTMAAVLEPGLHPKVRGPAADDPQAREPARRGGRRPRLVLARLTFDFALWSDGAIPILLACEEAHRYASADQPVRLCPARRAR